VLFSLGCGTGGHHYAVTPVICNEHHSFVDNKPHHWPDKNKIALVSYTLHILCMKAVSK
jgi:hypothetical protein